tara:strand:- start:3250 stop:4074 length:825 start_codon:yes stop_codon:yes gene_type:complete
MSVKKFAHTSIRPYVGECVFDSLVNPISPIYSAIRKMCKEEARERYAAKVGGVIEYTGGRTHIRWQYTNQLPACSLSLSNAMDGYAKAVFTAGRTDDDNAKIPVELSAADKAANAKRWKYTSDKGLSLSMRLMKKRGEEALSAADKAAKRPAWRGPSPAMRLMKKQGEEAKAPRLGGLGVNDEDDTGSLGACTVPRGTAVDDDRLALLARGGESTITTVPRNVQAAWCFCTELERERIYHCYLDARGPAAAEYGTKRMTYGKNGFGVRTHIRWQ